MSKIKQTEIYGSYQMLDQNNNLMCRCGIKRAHWYINRNLATWIDEPNGIFRLNFAPAGNGKADIKYYTQELENKCVVCGSTKDLNRHHVVPYVFRSKFPIEYKSRNHHDILPICTDCHEKYETQATILKSQLAKKYGTSINPQLDDSQIFNNKILKARKLISLAINNHSIPNEKIEEAKKIAAQDLLTIQNHEKTWGEIIVQEVLKNNELTEFIQLWRQHFIDNMNPQYLPEYWSVEHIIEKARTR